MQIMAATITIRKIVGAVQILKCIGADGIHMVYFTLMTMRVYSDLGRGVVKS